MAPQDLVIMGRITGAFGIKGWVKLEAFTETPKSLLVYPAGWVGGASGWTRCEVEQAEVQGAAVAAKFVGCDDRDAAALYGGREVGIERSAFPEAAENEYYWADLVGLKVVNAAGEDLGIVSRVFETGANDVLVVQSERERLIPFIEAVVQQVDLPGGVIRVDWGSDY